jgi:hypothetical protein
MSAPEIEPHPLFPPKDDEEDPPEVEAFHVTRLESAGWVYCRKSFAADELTSLEQLFELFGGGQFELVARANNRITAKRKYSMPGAPKPLNPGDPASGPVPPQAVAAPVAHDGSGGTNWAAIVVSVLPALLGLIAQFVQSGQAAAARQTEMLVAMLTNSKAEGQQFMTAFAQMQGQASQAQATLMATILEKLGQHPAAEPGASFKDGIEYAGEFLKEKMNLENGGGDDGTDAAVLQTVVQMAQGVMAGGKAAPPNGAASE